MLKEDVIASVAARAGVTKRVAENAVNAMIDTITEAMIADERVQLSNFGVFEAKLRRHNGYNFQTGEQMEVTTRRVPAFTPSDNLRVLLR